MNKQDTAKPSDDAVEPLADGDEEENDSDFVDDAEEQDVDDEEEEAEGDVEGWDDDENVVKRTTKRAPVLSNDEDEEDA